MNYISAIITKMYNEKLLRVVIVIITFLSCIVNISAQKTVVVRPQEIDDVLTNPGIGFTTFNRFNGDDRLLDEGTGGLGWTQDNPIIFPEFNGSLEMHDHPLTSIAYFRFHWKYIEPEMGNYNWALIDKVLKIAHERNQTLMLRVAPYGNIPERDVPVWYRSMIGEKSEWEPVGKKWMVDPEDPRYAFYFGRMITELSRRYDGHPDIEAVDVGIVGAFGEGDGSQYLTQKTRETLVKAYTDNFIRTPLIMLLTDKKTNEFGLSQANVAYRIDCIGDLGFWAKDQSGFTHMWDRYPQNIINCGMKDAWKTAPLSFEICGTLVSLKGKKGSCKYCQGYDSDDIKYIIDETLKWHMSSFNAKFTSVPEEWRPLVDEWLKKMGYRFVLRKFTFPEFVSANGKLLINSWWDNKGVAPCYKDFLLAIRLTNENKSEVLITDANIRTWFPGDNLYDDAVFIPMDMPSGNYNLQIGIVDRQSHKPKVNLAIEGRDADGWYSLGKIDIK